MDKYIEMMADAKKKKKNLLHAHTVISYKYVRVLVHKHITFPEHEVKHRCE